MEKYGKLETIIHKVELYDYYMENAGGDLYYHLIIGDEETAGYIAGADFKEMVLLTEDLSDYEYFDEDVCEYGYSSKRKKHMLHDWFYNQPIQDRKAWVMKFINEHSDIAGRILDKII